MRILHIITTINRGGAENHLTDLIQGQVRSYGCAVACAYLKGNGYWAPTLEALGVRVIPLNLTRYGEIGPLWRLRDALRSFQPELVHAHLAPAELYARAALVGHPGLPFVISRHDERPFYTGPGNARVERWVVRRASRVIAISESVRKFYSARWPDDLGKRFQRVHYGIDPAPYRSISAGDIAALRRQWGISNDTVLVGTVARMVPAKALDILLEGFAAYVRANSGREVKLVLVGTGPLEEQLKRKAADIGLREQVIWAGFRQDIPTVMHAITIFALSSVTEGFGLVLLEAMAAGKPVIASEISAIPEIVINGTTGILVPPRSPAAIAQALTILVMNPRLREHYGQAGRQRAEQEFGLGAMFRRTIDCYQAVLSDVRV